ncbi:hypothetical protein D8Y24_09085 [Agrococcus lahaulensis]|nr:hypothetical protein D8Y24_09085 [Agrococcus lahaulensis]
MNPEQHPAERTSKHARRRERDHYSALDHLFERVAASDEDAARLEHLVREHGSPLLAFVIAARDHDISLTSATLEDQFAQAHLASSDRYEHILEDFRRFQGWDDDLERSGIPEGLLRWDVEAFADWLDIDYLVIHLDGTLHLFDRGALGLSSPQQ